MGLVRSEPHRRFPWPAARPPRRPRATSTRRSPTPSWPRWRRAPPPGASRGRASPPRRAWPPAAQAIVDGYHGPEIRHGGDVACYSPVDDVLTMPSQDLFGELDEYYSTLFHELGHSTGHASRLGRDMANTFGSHAYGREELVA